MRFGEEALFGELFGVLELYAGDANASVRLAVVSGCRTILEAMADAEEPAPEEFRAGLGEVLTALQADVDAGVRDEADELAGVLEAFGDD